MQELFSENINEQDTVNNMQQNNHDDYNFGLFYPNKFHNIFLKLCTNLQPDKIQILLPNFKTAKNNLPDNRQSTMTHKTV